MMHYKRGEGWVYEQCPRSEIFEVHGHKFYMELRKPTDGERYLTSASNNWLNPDDDLWGRWANEFKSCYVWPEIDHYKGRYYIVYVPVP